MYFRLNVKMGMNKNFFKSISIGTFILMSLAVSDCKSKYSDTLLNKAYQACLQGKGCLGFSDTKLDTPLKTCNSSGCDGGCGAVGGNPLEGCETGYSFLNKAFIKKSYQACIGGSGCSGFAQFDPVTICNTKGCDAGCRLANGIPPQDPGDPKICQNANE
jgi:hypothetical protein